MRVICAAVLVLWFITSSLSQQQCPSSDDDYDADVLIFGAGITGLTIARYLHDNGITDIKVLEARDEIGGRIRSATFGGSVVEVGANWIHEVPRDESDRDKQPIWKLAKDSDYCLDLKGHFTETSEIWLPNEDGEYTQSDDNDDTYSKYEEATSNIEELANQLRNDDEDDITVREAFTRSDWRPTTPLELSIDWQSIDFSVAESPSNTSLFRHFPDIAETGLGTLDYFISDQRGFSTILDCIADGIESKIQLGAMVNNISWNDDCVCASVTIDSQEQTMCGKYGVVTFSIGVLQDWIRSKFSPPLSSRKQNAINALGMGYYLKIFVQFSRTFWNDDVDYIYRGDSRRGYYPVISPLGQLFPGSPSIVILTVTGSEAIRIANQSINTTKDEIMVVLRDLYGNSIPDITDILVPTWISDPLYKGMYSFSKFGSSDEDVASLKQPEGDRLYFSGEGVSIPFIGALHGGYCEGLSTGEEILKANGMDVSTSSLPQCPSSGSITKSTVTLIVMSSLLFLLFL